MYLRSYSEAEEIYAAGNSFLKSHGLLTALATRLGPYVAWIYNFEFKGCALMLLSPSGLDMDLFHGF